jgi:hypothetical protein
MGLVVNISFILWFQFVMSHKINKQNAFLFVQQLFLLAAYNYLTKSSTVKQQWKSKQLHCFLEIVVLLDSMMQHPSSTTVFYLVRAPIMWSFLIPQLRYHLYWIHDFDVVAINSFLNLNNGYLAYVVSVDQNGLCLCKEAQGEFLRDDVLPYNFVSNQIRLYRLDQLYW